MAYFDAAARATRFADQPVFGTAAADPGSVSFSPRSPDY